MTDKHGLLAAFVAVLGLAGCAEPGTERQTGQAAGSAAPVAYQGKLILSLGYGFASKMPGNALLVLEAGR